MLRIATMCAIALGMTSLATAQSVCIPLPRLLTTTPMGGQAGTSVEITITGENIEDASDLHFAHSGITAKHKLDANGQPLANQYILTIAPDCPTGLHEARVMTRLGISSSRVFSVDKYSEVLRSAPNTSLTSAMPLKLNTVCNASATAKSVDHYVFEATQGQRIIIHCAAGSIDSKLQAVLILGDEAGRDLMAERRGGSIDFKVPQDGKYVIKVHDLTFNGGPAYYYRLALLDVPADAPLPQFASTRAVSAFSWPPTGLAAAASSAEAEPNHQGAQAQKISLPCDISGSFYPAADVDTFEFTAKKGEVWWVEVASERLGLPTDPAILVQHVSGEGAEQKLTDVVELSDIPSPVKVSSNGYAYDGPPYNGGSSDILGKLEIKEDGVHRLQISDLFGGTRNDPRNVYRLVVRKAAPDFAVVGWGMHMELRNGDRNALSKPIALRGGLTMALEVVAIRRDGFDGPIDLVMEGLPAGVTAQGLRIPAGQSSGVMLLTADEHAPPGLAYATFYGKALIDGKEVTHPCFMAEMAWPVPDSWGEIPSPRLVSSVPVSVTGSELAPLTLSPEQKQFEVAAGEKVTIPLKHLRRSEFSGSVLQLKTFGEGFKQHPRFDVSLAADRSEAVLDLAALKTPPGDYVVAFYGSAVAKYSYNPAAVDVAKAAVVQAEARVKELAAEVERLTAEAASAPVEKKATSEQALAEAKTKQQAATAAVAAAQGQLKVATERATPRDTVDIVVSEPIAIHVKPAETK